MKSYAIIGIGRFGTRIATCLFEHGNDVMVIDKDPELIENIAEKVTRAVVADAKNKNDLKRLGVADCDYVIVSMGSDLASSVLITMNVKSIGAKFVICKASDEMHREILKKLGADKVIIPEYDMAEKTAMSLISPNFLEFIELSDEYGIIEISAPSTWVDKTIKELDVRAKYGINIVGIKQNGKTNVNVPADYVITKEQKLIVLGEYKSLEKIQKVK